jgi:hypothetical protein
MAWRTAFCIGLLVALVCHLALISQNTSSLYVWPGMMLISSSRDFTVAQAPSKRWQTLRKS